MVMRRCLRVVASLLILLLPLSSSYAPIGLMGTARVASAATVAGSAVFPAAPGRQAIVNRPSMERPDPTPETPEHPSSADPSLESGAPRPSSQERREDTEVPQEIADVPGATQDWWGTVVEQIRLDAYSLTAQESDDGPTSYRGYCPDHDLILAFAEGGLRLTKSTATLEDALQKPQWTWALHTTGYGAEGDVRPLPPPTETTTEANRLAYHRPGLVEWYLNDDRSVEQGFTLDAPPADGDETVVVEMTLTTDLVPMLSGDPDSASGQALQFTRPEGNVIVLRYSELYAHDAAGRQLPARMALERDARDGGYRLRLILDATDADYPLTIDPLITPPPWTAVGTPSSRFGASVSTAGDVNGDGYGDVVVGAPHYANSDGKVYVYYGSKAGLGDSPAWTWLYAGEHSSIGDSVACAGDVNGDGYDDLVIGAPDKSGGYGLAIVFHGSEAGLQQSPAWYDHGDYENMGFGDSVSSAGDVNGDTFEDLVVGAPGYNSHQGKVYVYLGSRDGLKPEPVWTVEGEHTYSYLGHAVATAGDVNGDQLADIIVGAPLYDDDDGGTDVGKAYVYLGPLSPDQEPTWTATGEMANDKFGWAVGPAGNVNADDFDAFDDFVVGAPNAAGDRGKVYVYHGAQAVLEGTEPAWTSVGEYPDDNYGLSVGTAGDVNGDGCDDLVVGAELNDTNGTNAGKAYVYAGSPEGLGSIPMWTAAGEAGSDLFGFSVATAGDIDGDEHDDLIVGAKYNDDNGDSAGKAYVYYGSALGPNPAHDWAADGENADDHLGYAVAPAGDVNGDGYGNVVVGAPGIDETGSSLGRTYVYHGSPTNLGLTPSTRVEGESLTDQYGAAVASAGDLDGDGYDEIVVGAPGYDSDRGKAYVYFGSEVGLDADNPWTAVGINTRDAYGAAVASAGDVNADGYADLVVGAVDYPQGNETGIVYVYHGSQDGLTTTTASWSAFGTSNGDRFGCSVATAGDVNRDRYADLIVGASGIGNNRGKACVYHGSSNGLGDQAAWSKSGDAESDQFGYSVSTAGDVNGNGYADVIVGAPGAHSDTGTVQVYCGSASGLGGSYAWTRRSWDGSARYGAAVGTAGDVDGDGYADIIVGAPGIDDVASQPGRAYVYTRGQSSPILNTSFMFSGAMEGDWLGFSVATAGDVDGDGFSDLLVGAHGSGEGRGKVYVYHGTAPGLGGTPAWSDRGEGARECFGWSVSSAGDVNGDGFADLVVGVPRDADDAGKAYVYYGSRDGLSATPNWAKEEGSGSFYGYSVAPAGDVNGDGYADLIIGAPGTGEHGPEPGRAYVYYGSRDGMATDCSWSVAGEAAGDGFGLAVGSAGDVNGDGFADLVVGAGWHDSGGLRDSGRAYVFYGSSAGPSSEADWTVDGEAPRHFLGFAVAAAGDLNGDGYGDFVIGAPSNSPGGSSDTGRVHIFHGSCDGPSSDPSRTLGGEAHGDCFGSSVGSAGDVNGDGFADLVVLASNSDSDPGKVYVYHGSPHGVDVPYFTYSGSDDSDTSDCGISSVGTAGDVNGDGYADVVIGAEKAFNRRGRVYIHYGSDDPSPTFHPVVDGYGQNSQFGNSVATAGDVNGDGYSDIIVGAPYSDDGASDAGKVYLYQGNDGGGKTGLARQVCGDGSGQPVQPWGPSYTPDSFGVELAAFSPMGRGRARLQVEHCPPGVPFGDASCQTCFSEDWIDVSASSNAVYLDRIVYGLQEGDLHRWRARALYNTPLYRHGPWRRPLGQAMEADVRSTRVAADLSLTKTMAPTELARFGDPLTYTLTYTSNGPARGVVITDIVPSGITDTVISSSGAVITDTGYTPGYVWQVGSLETGEGGTITIAGVAQSDRFINTATIGGTSPDPNLANNSATVQTHIAGVLYVDVDATGANNGQTWADAYTDLREALSEAAAGDQIWVAEGVYKPTTGVTRTCSFELVGGVALHGGFGGDEVWLSDRDPMHHRTILSGDIGTENNPDDNVYHVVLCTLEDDSSLIEGVTIIGGNANGDGEKGTGGGLLNRAGSPTLINVSFLGNAAREGGGMYSFDSEPKLVNVVFSGNTAGEGGGMYNLGQSPSLINTTFSLNEANSGGAIFNLATGPSLTNSILWGNTPDQMPNGQGTMIRYCDIQGECPPAVFTDAIISQDPQFWNPKGDDGIAGTLDDDLRIRSTARHPSPVIDVGVNQELPADRWDLDDDGDMAEPLPRDISGRWRQVGFTAVEPVVDMGAYEATVVDALAEGESLFELGESFRTENLQLISSDTLAEALKNYANFNGGEWYYSFCGDYDAIDGDGYCPDCDPQAVRNTLLDAVDLCRVGVGWPTEVFDTVHGEQIPAWERGAQGVLSSTTEIANVHLIFGNEFLVDATDYRFSTAGIPYADQIIAQELDELEQAQRQFELIMDLIVRAFNEWGVGAYCNSDQFEQFGVASSRMASVLGEIAARHYMLRDSEEALAVYKRAYDGQYLHLMALAEVADETGEDYVQNGGYEMLNNLSQMRERAQAIHDGLDFFGFAPDYAPLQAYEQLLRLTEGPNGDTGLLGTARGLETQARDAQRTFDTNASDMSTELESLEYELNNQLHDICGDSDDDYQTCEGGLMAQNLDAMDAAALRVALAYQRAQNIVEQIQIEEERAGQVIMVELDLGNELSASELAIGKLQAERTTDIEVYSSENQIYLGVEIILEAYLQQEFEWDTIWPEWTFKGGFKETLKGTAGYQHAWSWINSEQTIWDPTANEIAGYASVQALKQAEAQAAIEGANSAAVVRNLLLQQSEALQEYEIAMAEFNKLVSEHNHLAERLNRRLNQREQAINRVASHNSHLLSPAYRIWRDSLTTQSNEALAMAAQFAYLTARASEYDLLTPYPELGKIFRARTGNDIRLFLNDLKVWVQATDLPGQLNSYPYTLSLAQDICDHTEEALDPDDTLSEGEIQLKRFDEFQSDLQAEVDGDLLKFDFVTVLDQQRAENQYLFSPNIWNNRIAGIDEPMDGNAGIAVNIITRQSGDVGNPEVVLVHGSSVGGAEAYRNVAGETVYYDPGTAVPVGYLIPGGLNPPNTTAVIQPAINGVGGSANGAMVNLSVASSWTLAIPADSRGNLDYSQIEDIEISLDTTGRALPWRVAQAEQDALRLQAGLKMAPVEIAPSLMAPAQRTARRVVRSRVPSVPGGIGGSYSGSVMVTSPLTIAIQVLDLDLWNAVGVLTGTVAVAETSLYSGTIGLHGQATGEAFSLTSGPSVTVVAGRTVTRSFELVGQMEDDGDSLSAVYTGTITNLLPDPILVQGRYRASRPAAMGAERLLVSAQDWSVPSSGSTAITATLYSRTMERLTETCPLTFTTNLGSVPAVVEAIDGQVAVTYDAGDMTGQATIWASNGEITGGVRIQVSEPLALQAAFSASPRGGSAPLMVAFGDRSPGTPTSFAWDFGDGSSSTEQHPAHEYVSAGNYAVSLTVGDGVDTDTLTQPNYVVVEEPMAPEAAFSASPASGRAPLRVAFTDQSSHYPTGWAWDFGDGSTSVEQNPVHTYQRIGTFATTLTVSNTMGSDVIVVPDCIVAFEGDELYLPLVFRSAS